MTLTDNEIQEAADMLAVADENVALVEQLTRRYPGMEPVAFLLRAPLAGPGVTVDALSEYGTQLLPDQFIMSGSFTAATFVHPGDVVSATIGGLGTTSLTFA